MSLPPNSSNSASPPALTPLIVCALPLPAPLQVLPGKFNVLVTTYEFIMRDRSKLCRIDWKYMVIDEAQV